MTVPADNVPRDAPATPDGGARPASAAEAAPRARGRRRIGLQLIAVVGLASVAIIGPWSYLLVRSHQRALLAQVEVQAEQISETIKSSTRYAMLLNRRDDVHQIIDTVGGQEDIEAVRIFNKEGRIIYSPAKAAVGEMVDKRAEACYACHASDSPLSRLSMTQRTRVFSGANGARYLGIVTPIYNEPSCLDAACHAHPVEQNVLGVLDVTMPLAEVDRQIATDRSRAVLLALATIAGLSLIIWLLFHTLIGQPIAQLLRATSEVAAGDLNYKIAVRRDDELGTLQASFNAMTARLQETRAQLYQSERLASLGRLAAGIAHEINNPLTGVLTFSSFLLKRAEPDSETRADLETIVRESKRCRQIVRGLLDFARQVPPHKTAVDLHTVVARALEILDRQLGARNVTVTTALADSLPSIRADANQLLQVLINLLINAADAIGAQGGDVLITTGVEPGAGGDTVYVKVADTGCGIEPENLERLFEPFFTTKDRQGTGLGLAVAWGIVNEHHGTIEVSSKPRRGATFTVRLPVETAAAAGEAPA